MRVLLKIQHAHALARPAYALMLAALAASFPLVNGCYEPPHKVSFNLASGQNSQKRNDFENARGFYEKVLAVEPDNAAALNGLGECFYHWEDYGTAAKHFKHSLQSDPTNANAAIHLADISQRTGEEDEARLWLEKAIAAQPDSAENHLLIAELLIEKDTARALEHFAKAVALDPDKTEAWYDYGMALRRSRSWDEAAAAFEKACEQKPNSPKNWARLGEMLVKMQKPAEAEAAFKKALELKPDDIENMYEYAKGLVDMGRRDEAIVEFERLLKLAPDHGRAYYRVAWIHEKEGRREEAGKYYSLAAENIKADEVLMTRARQKAEALLKPPSQDDSETEIDNPGVDDPDDRERPSKRAKRKDLKVIDEIDEDDGE